MATLKAGRCLCRMRRAEASLSVVATGGKENDLQIWDLNKPSEHCQNSLSLSYLADMSCVITAQIPHPFVPRMFLPTTSS